MRKTVHEASLPQCRPCLFCVLLVAGLLFLACSGCGADTKSEAPDTSPEIISADTVNTDAAPDTGNSKLSLPAGEVYSDGTIRIAYNSYIETADKLFLDCTVENSSDVAYTIASQTISVNGIVVPDGIFYCASPAHGRDNAVLYININILHAIGISEIRDIAIECSIYKTERVFEKYSTGVIRFTNAAASSHETQTLAPFAETVYESDAVRITATPFLYANDEPLYFLGVCLENRTDSPMTAILTCQGPDSCISPYNPIDRYVHLNPGGISFTVVGMYAEEYDMDAVSAGDNIALLRATGNIGSVKQGWDTGECRYNISTGALTPFTSQQAATDASVDTVLRFPQGSLYTDGNLSIDYLGCDKVNWGYRLVFSVTNTSVSDDWAVVSDSILVNGMPISTSVSVETTAGSSAECSLDIFQSELDDYLITEIGEVSISCSAKLGEDSVYNYKLRPLILRTGTAAAYEAMQTPSYDTVLYDTNLVRITAVSGKVKPGADYATLMLRYENKIGQALTVFSIVDYHGETVSMGLDSMKANSTLDFSCNFDNDDFGGALPVEDDVVTLELIGQVSVLESDTWIASGISYHVLDGEFDALPGGATTSYQPGAWDHGVYTNESLGFSVSLESAGGKWENIPVKELDAAVTDAELESDAGFHRDLVLINSANGTAICAVYLDSTWRDEVQLYESLVPTGHSNGSANGSTFERSKAEKRIVGNQVYTFGKHRFTNGDGSGISRYVLCRKIGDAAVVIYIDAETDALAGQYLSCIR